MAVHELRDVRGAGGELKHRRCEVDVACDLERLGAGGDARAASDKRHADVRLVRVLLGCADAPLALFIPVV